MPIDEILEIKCPLCGKPHRYGLAVEIITFMGSSPDPTPTFKPNICIHKFTRLFTCPEKNEEFQATIKLKETGRNPIQDVRVIGVVEG